ncbi:Na(+)/citrate cotransporter, partial [Parasteatoda tepidariorum]
MQQEARCSYVILLVATYWLLEPVPISATALLPVVLFPILDVVGSADICLNYLKESFMMFIGGLLMAISVEECRLHERISLKILMFMGSDIKWLMLGFMMTTAFLSMWISNTATTAMMIPIVEAVHKKISIPISNDIALEENTEAYVSEVSTENKEVENASNEEIPNNENLQQRNSSIKTVLLLCVCYSANIGGTGSLTGTGTNLVIKVLVDDLYPESDEITFGSWIVYSLPGVIICVSIGWFYLWLIYFKCSKSYHRIASKQTIQDVISKKYKELGSIRFHEAEVIVLFLLLVLLWVFRDPKFVSGWQNLISFDKKIGDSVPAIAIAFLLFFLPSDIRNLDSPRILDWRRAQSKLPWGVIILCGGGFALADAAQRSGLSKLVSTQLSPLQVLPPIAIVTVVCLMSTMLTEILMNTTTATILMPVFNQMALSIRVNPLLIMLPMTFACS